MRGRRHRRITRTAPSNMRRLEALRPSDPDQLHRFVRLLVGVRVPRVPMIEGNNAPFEYLEHSFFENTSGKCGDLVVWANRGGGKTYLGAVATLLDMIFKPGIQIRILGGSLEQSGQMYGYLRDMLQDRPAGASIVRQMTRRRIKLVNGSTVEVLSQSERSVRGQRVHKLRCDEVELFHPDVWSAAQRVTRSGLCGDVRVTGTIEALSTMHVPYGLMSRLVRQSHADGAARVLRWCAMDVIQRCPAERDCAKCALWTDCGGRAKHADGFVPVDDLVVQRERSTDEDWGSEMMCQRPKRTHSVYKKFDPTPGKAHVRQVQRPAPDAVGNDRHDAVIAGMDFGMRGATVVLWAILSPGGSGLGVVRIFGEYFAQDRTLDENLDRIEAMGLAKPSWIAVDPAGCQRNSQTGLRDVDILKQRGYHPRWCRSHIAEGIKAIQRRIEKQTLIVDPRCEQLIEAIVAYHFDHQNPLRQDPVKDGPDHGCDALRYMIVNLDRRSAGVQTRSYI